MTNGRTQGAECEVRRVIEAMSLVHQWIYVDYHADARLTPNTTIGREEATNARQGRGQCACRVGRVGRVAWGTFC